MSVFDKGGFFKLVDRDDVSDMHTGKIDSDVFTLEQLYQDFKKRYDEECKKDEMETRRITEKLRKQLIKDGLLTED